MFVYKTNIQTQHKTLLVIIVTAFLGLVIIVRIHCRLHVLETRTVLGVPHVLRAHESTTIKHKLPPRTRLLHVNRIRKYLHLRRLVVAQVRFRFGANAPGAAGAAGAVGGVPVGGAGAGAAVVVEPIVAIACLASASR